MNLAFLLIEFWKIYIFYALTLSIIIVFLQWYYFKTQLIYILLSFKKSLISNWLSISYKIMIFNFNSYTKLMLRKTYSLFFIAFFIFFSNSGILAQEIPDVITIELSSPRQTVTTQLKFLQPDYMNGINKQKFIS